MWQKSLENALNKLKKRRCLHLIIINVIVNLLFFKQKLLMLKFIHRPTYLLVPKSRKWIKRFNASCLPPPAVQKIRLDFIFFRILSTFTPSGSFTDYKGASKKKLLKLWCRFSCWEIFIHREKSHKTKENKKKQ